MSKFSKKVVFSILAASILSYSTFSIVGRDVIEVNAETSVNRIQGKDRFETAALISQQGFKSANTVYIASSVEFADALSGVPLAYQNNAPILLANGTKLRDSIVDEIVRLNASKAVILGGKSAVSSEIEQSLKKLGLLTERLAGENRYETSAIIAQELSTHVKSNKAAVVNGMEFADAMSIAPIAAREGMPIYLSKSNSLSNSNELKEYSSTYIIGGEKAVSANVANKLNNVVRIAGADRYETNRKVINNFKVNTDKLYIATGLNFADALTGSVLSAKGNTSIALVRGDVHSKLIDIIENKNFSKFTIVGGESAVPKRVVNRLLNKPIEEVVIKPKPQPAPKPAPAPPKEEEVIPEFIPVSDAKLEAFRNEINSNTYPYAVIYKSSDGIMIYGSVGKDGGVGTHESLAHIEDVKWAHDEIVSYLKTTNYRYEAKYLRQIFTIFIYP